MAIHSRVFPVVVLFLSFFLTDTSLAKPVGGEPRPHSSCCIICNQGSEDSPGGPGACSNHGTGEGCGCGMGLHQSKAGESYPISSAQAANGVGLSLSLNYTSYNADGEKAVILTPLGYGWSHSYQMYVFKQGYDLFKMSPTGLTTKYQRQGRRTGPLVATRGHQQSIVENPDGSVVITNHDQLSFRFETIPGNPLRVAGVAPLMLTQIVDRNGNITQLSYASGLLDTVTGPFGRILQFHYDAAGRLIRVTDPDGRETLFSYDSAGNLASITDPLGQLTQYTYDVAHRLRTRTDKKGQLWRYEYDSAGHPVRIRDPEGDSLFSLTNSSNWATDLNALFLTKQRVYVPSTTTVTDGRGNVWQYSYDANGIITKKVAPDGATTQYSYDPATLNLASETDANGHVTTYVYDAKGNLIQKANHLGHTWTYEYEPVFNMLIKMTDPNGRMTTYAYDGFGNRIQETDPQGNVMAWTYDSQGNRLSETDKNGHTTQYEYDSLGNLVKITDALGNITTMTYDTMGNLLGRTDANGHTTQYEYDALDRLVKETDPSGAMTLWTYDPLGNRTAMTDRNGNPTLYDYDARSRLIKVTDALGGMETYEYDGNSNRIGVTDKNNHSTEYAYDVQNRLMKTTDALGFMTTMTYDGVGNLLTQTNANGHAFSSTYDDLNRQISMVDAEGNLTQFGYEGDVVCPVVGCPTFGSSLLTKQTDAEGKVTYFKYDELDRKTMDIRKQTDVADSIDGDDAVTQYSYDAMGNQLSMTEPNGNTVTFGYDAIDRLVQETNAAGDVTTLSYDGVGNTVTMTSPNGNQTNYTYDALDRQINVADSLGQVATYTYDAEGKQLSRSDGNGNGTTYTYDAIYRIIQTTDALGSIASFSYDPVGNLLTVLDRESQQTQYLYDDINRRTQAIDAIGAVTTYEYDGVGNLIRITDANNHATGYLYDGVNRLTQEIYADGASRSYTYNGISNLLTRTDQKGQTTQYLYDDLHRLVRRDYPVSGDDILSYDLSGRLVSACREGGPDSLPADSCAGWLVNFSYDGANRVLSDTQNGQVVSYVYDIPGRTRTLTYPDNHSIIETKDFRARLDSIEDGVSPSIVKYSYDAANRVLTRSYRNGVTATYSYNNNDWITSLQHQRTDSSLVAGFGYSYDNEGNKLFEEQVHQPSRSEAYQYDDIFRLVEYRVGTLAGSTIPIPATQTQYDLDLVGNWNSKISDGSTEARNHNDVNEITDIDGATLLSDDNGNLQADTNYSYSYDEEQRLVQITRTADMRIIARYYYDSMRRRVAKVIDPFQISAPEEVRYFHDAERVVEEQSPNGTTLAIYTYGNYVDELLTMQRDGNTYYYHQNTLWSVAAITSSAAAVVEQYNYAPYGKVAIFDGLNIPVAQNSWNTPHSAIGNPYLFTGRELDEESELFFLRARYYDVNKGRFIQRDAMGYIEGLNLYEYVSSRPTGFMDPIGYRKTPGKLEYVDCDGPCPIDKVEVNDEEYDCKDCYCYVRALNIAVGLLFDDIIQGVNEELRLYRRLGYATRGILPQRQGFSFTSFPTYDWNRPAADEKGICPECTCIRVMEITGHGGPGGVIGAAQGLGNTDFCTDCEIFLAGCKTNSYAQEIADLTKCKVHGTTRNIPAGVIWACYAPAKTPKPKTQNKAAKK